MPTDQARTVAVNVTCCIFVAGNRVGKEKLKICVSAPDKVRAKIFELLPVQLRKRASLAHSHLRQYQITRLRCRAASLRPNSTEQQDGEEDGGGGADVAPRPDPLLGGGAASWPPGMRSVRARAHITASLPSVPQEMRVRVLLHRRWPASFYLRAQHRIRCGCEGCQALRSDGGDGGDGDGPADATPAAAAAATNGSPAGGASSGGGSPQYARRRLGGFSQSRGFWSPACFIEHVVGARLRGSRQPRHVPKLTSENWLTFEVPPPPGEAGEEEEEGQEQGEDMEEEEGQSGPSGSGGAVGDGDDEAAAAAADGDSGPDSEPISRRTRACELRVSELVRQFGIRWQPKLPFPPL